MKFKSKVVSIVIAVGMIFHSVSFALVPTRELFVESKDVEALLSVYREAYSDSDYNDDELLEIARSDWLEIARKEAQNVKTEKSLPAQVVEVDGVKYRLYGYAHGVSKPFMDFRGKYRDFVLSAYQEERNGIENEYCEIDSGCFPSKFILGEENIGYQFDKEDRAFIDVKDHSFDRNTEPGEMPPLTDPVFYTGMSLYAVWAFITGSLIPAQLAGSIFSAISSGKVSFSDYISLIMNPEENCEYDWSELLIVSDGRSKTGDSMDVETKQAIWDGKLPSHLEMELLLKSVEDEDELVNEHNCTTRSLYMAGFLTGFAEMGGFGEVVFFMGSGHLPEVKGVLTDANGYAQSTTFYQNGHERGAQLAANIIEAQQNGNIEDVYDLITNRIPYDLLNQEDRLQDVTYMASAAGVVSGMVLWSLWMFSSTQATF